MRVWKNTDNHTIIIVFSRRVCWGPRSCSRARFLWHDENTLYIKLNRAVWWPWFVRWPICYALLPARPPPRAYGRARVSFVCVQRARKCTMFVRVCERSPRPRRRRPPARSARGGGSGGAVLLAVHRVPTTVRRGWRGSELRTRCAYIERGPLREGRTRFHVSPPALSHS